MSAGIPHGPHADAWRFDRTATLRKRTSGLTNPWLTPGVTTPSREGGDLTNEVAPTISPLLVAEFYGASYRDGFIFEQLLEDGFAYRLVGFYDSDGFEDAAFRGGGVLAA